MGKKETFKRYDSFWPFFSNRKHTFFSFNQVYPKLLRTVKLALIARNAFTLVELAVVLTILSVLSVLLFLFLNPNNQLKKARNTQRQGDINEVTKAINLYYDDHGCFPDSIPWGEVWEENNTIYMKKVPNGPTCRNAFCTEYTYIAEGTCPQWFGLFSDQEQPAIQISTTCGLSSLSNCIPQGSVNPICSYGGTVSCTNIAGSSLLTPTPVGYEAPATTPTPTINTCPLQNRQYACRNGACNDVGAGNGEYCTSNCDGVCN